jgi:Fur family transcriptional regulator, ferric uptake regulator
MPHRSQTGDTVLPPAVERLANELGNRGHKLTRPRLAVLQAVSALGDSFTVNEIEQWLTHQGASPGIASIFRTVKLLTELDVLQRIHGLDDCHRYSLSQGHRHHVICTECGALTAFDDCELRAMVERLEDRTGYRVERHLLELFGRCPRCQST